MNDLKLDIGVCQASCIGCTHQGYLCRQFEYLLEENKKLKESYNNLVDGFNKLADIANKNGYKIGYVKLKEGNHES